MFGPPMIFCESNGTVSPSVVTWLLPSGTKRPVLPERTRAQAGVPSHIVPEYLLDGAYHLAVGACYLRAKEFFGLRGHGDISPRVAITG